MDRQFIQKLVSEVDIKPGANKNRVQASFVSLSRNALPELLEQVMEGASSEGSKRFEKLTVDLGTMTAEEMDREFPERLKKRLAEILKHSPAIDRKIDVTEESLENPLFHFLLTGTLPWWASSSLKLEKLIEETLAGGQKALCEFLLINRRKYHMLQRLVYNFSAKQLNELTGLLAPSEAGLVKRIAREMEDLQEKERIFPAEPDPFHEAVWLLVLQYLLYQERSGFNLKSYVSFLLEGLARTYEVAYLEVLEYTMWVLRELKVTKGESLPYIFHILYKEQSVKSAKELEAKRQMLDEMFSEWIQMLSTKAPADIESRLNFLIDEYRDELILYLCQQERKSDRSISLLVAQSSLGTKRILLEAFADSETGFVEAFVEQLADARRQEEEFFRPVERRQWTIHVWGLVFHVLLTDFGSVFNTKSFIRLAIRKIAASEQLDERELLGMVVRSILAEKDQAKQGLGRILRELADEEAFKINKFKEIVYEGSEGMSPAERWFEALERSAAQSVKQPSGFFYEVLNDKRFRELLFHFGQRESIRGSIVRRLEERQVYRLLPFLAGSEAPQIIGFSRQLQETQKRQNQLFRGGERHFYCLHWQLILQLLLTDRGSVFNTKSFVKQVLHSLSASYQIEYGELLYMVLESSRLLGSGQGTARIFQELREENLPKHTFAFLYKDVVQKNSEKTAEYFFRRFSQATQSEFLEYFQWLQKKNPAAARRLLGGFLGNKKMREKLAGSASEKLLTHWITFFFPDECQRIMRLLSFLEQWQRQLPAVTFREFHQQKWRAILEELGRARLRRCTFERFMELTLNRLVGQAYFSGVKEIQLLAEQLVQAGYGKLSSDLKRKWQVKLPEISPKKALHRKMEGISRTSGRKPVWKSDRFFQESFQLTRSGLRELIISLKDDPSAKDLECFAGSIPLAVQEAWLIKLGQSRFVSLIEQLLENLSAYAGRATDREKIRMQAFTLFFVLYIKGQSISFSFIIQKIWQRLEAEWLKPSESPADFFAFLNERRADKDSLLLLAMREISESYASRKPLIFPVHQTEKELSEKPNAAVSEGEKHFVENAGLVLLWPFFVQLFKTLDYLEGLEFRDSEHQYRAVILTQYAAFGDERPEEHLSSLNKILCGLPLDTSLPKRIRLESKEKELAGEMLKGVLANWEKLSNTTVAGLRETFLLRSGSLMNEEHQFVLAVEKKGVDVLLDSLPWSFSTVKMHWMTKPLVVLWN